VATGFELGNLLDKYQVALNGSRNAFIPIVELNRDLVRSFHRKPLSTNEKKLVTIDRDELSCFKSGQQDLNCSCSP